MFVIVVILVFAFLFYASVNAQEKEKRKRIAKAHYMEATYNRLLQPTLDKLDRANDELEKKLAESKARNDEWSRQFGIVMGYQNKGMDYEKQKKYVTAAQYYEKALQSASELSMMHGKAEHSAERLAVIYRRMKEYDKEISAIEYALSSAEIRNDTTRLAKLQDRLLKAKTLKDKTK